MTTATINGVKNYYGPRHRHEGRMGQVRTAGTEKQLVLKFGGDTYTEVSFTLPAGATVTGNALVQVDEVFVIGGTTPNIAVGVSGSETTNYLALIPEASLEALGTYSIAPAGTLAINAPLAAAATVVIALEGDTTITGAGRATLTVPYRVI